MKVKCPRCGLLFNAPHGNGAGSPYAAPAAVAAVQAVPFASPAPAPPPPAAIRATPPAALAGAPAGQEGLRPAPGLRRPPSKGKRLALVLGGVAALVAVAVVVVLLCFAGDKAPEPTGGDNTAGPNTEVSDPWASAPGQKAAKPAKKKTPVPLIVLPPEEQKKIDAAVKKGADWLRTRQQADGTWPGGHRLGLACLCALTLLEAGAAPADPAVQKTAAYVREVAEKYTSGHETYELSLAILFLDKLNDKEDRQRIQQITLRLAAAQNAGGGWTYRCPPLSGPEAEELYGLLKDLKTKTVDELHRDGERMGRLSPRLRSLPLLRQQPVPAEGWRSMGDNSNTQFATLALLAARRHDVPLDKTLSLLARRFRNSQNADGSWNYLGNHNPVPQYPTMTCAGLLGLAVSFDVDTEHRAKGVRPTDDPAVQRGLKRLAQTIGEPGQGQPPRVYLYYLWSMERVGVLYQLKTIEGKKWYEWGVDILHKHQRPDGSWMNGGLVASDLSDTCFAILFLQRANLAQDLTDKLEELNALPGPGRPPVAGKKD
jgi:hypothetical protein